MKNHAQPVLDLAADEAGSPAERCKTCATVYSSKYCPACGEKRVSLHDYSLTHFVENVFEVFTHFDIKVFRTLRALIFTPGTLTVEYLEGRRKPTLSPVRLFVIVNVAFFILSSLVHVHVFNQPLKNQIGRREHLFGNLMSERKQRMVEAEMARRHVGFEEFEKEFDDNSDAHAESLVFTMILPIAASVAILCGLRRRYLFEHVVFATHSVTFFLVYMMLVLPALILIVVALQFTGLLGKMNGTGLDPLAAGIIVFGMAAYLFAACRRVYRGGIPVNLLRAAALSLTIVPVLQLYRVLLFFVAINSMR